ncbi:MULTISPECIES: hypothetical protein [Oxalobacteraceae]|jgi:hypothetical protein|uniref:hypothetical protein n=1 Tax=Oxalobacteraceae TaxID=75682 RepID=UPI0010A37A87|nr:MULTISPECIES: hypothetical protein [Oxalobacteraceae]
MTKQSDPIPPTPRKPNLLTLFARNYSGPITGVALSALSAWMIVTGLKGLAGFEVTQQSALADLLGIVIIIGVARWLKIRFNVK